MGILIVDDNQVNLFVIEKILNRAGYNDYKSFKSAMELFDYLQIDHPTPVEKPVDLILMDIMMPEIDGIEACRRIQETPHLKDIPIIFVTALEDSNKVAEALDVGGLDYVMKPINKTELLARMRVVLRLKAEKDWHKKQDEKIRNELELSMQVQTSMLSEPILHDHILMKASYLPANTLAGDMYYWYRIDKHRYAAIILDMMGHGISASLVCMFISSVLRDSIHSCSDPEYVMDELNRWMHTLNSRNHHIPYYFTAIYTVIDTQKKTVEYVNAGHPAGFALIDGKEVVALSDRTCAVGFFEQIQVRKTTLSYQHTLQLLLFTDGVEEAVARHGQESGFLEAAASSLLPAEGEPIDCILTREHQTHASDDMCVVLIQAGNHLTENL
ncbi:response regulator [Mesobacillus campisalis]|uniref:Response regulator n=1 Tax=Mesobacillus campisalis TaxID=1408103 RepID=A0A0M2SXI3_9BACI|nr:fused response regulator/phosphatase [Mesobacillus campisalis]KKK39289.1 response regulator [Mesobacillus campisalis]